MSREAWNIEFVAIFRAIGVEVSHDMAWGAADANDDAFNDGMTPEDAVQGELENWTD
jgi:hypothetical protein